jgi:transcriptional regulator with XRE-family HTH domain
VPHIADDPTPEQRFGQLVRTAREAREWTQEVLARRLKEVTGTVIDQSGVARIEAGKRAVRFNEVVALSQLLKIDLEAAGRGPSLSSDDLMRLTVEAERLLAERDVLAAELEHAAYLRDRAARAHMEVDARLMVVEDAIMRAQVRQAEADAVLRSIVRRNGDGDGER